MQLQTPTVRPATVRKVFVRLIPLLIVLYVTSFLDRVNVGFAALQMNADLGFSATQFGFGSGIFFVGYCLSEVPSNLILARVGARLWIARIMLTWGLLASAMMFVHTANQFYVLRFISESQKRASSPASSFIWVSGFQPQTEPEPLRHS